MEIKAIRTEADYLAALQQVSALIDIDPVADSPEGELLEVLGTLVQAYEAKHYAIDPPDPMSLSEILCAGHNIPSKEFSCLAHQSKPQRAAKRPCRNSASKCSSSSSRVL